MSLILPGGGRRAIAGGNQVTFKIGPESGAHDLSMFESRISPGGGVFPHLHREFEEAFFVLEGELEFLLGDSWEAGPSGSAVHIPRGVVHAFRNQSQAPARLLVVHTPASAVRMIEELAGLPMDAPPSAARAILALHNSEFAAPPPREPLLTTS
jgi:quercetin dioxygenase-like cupin family protein